MRYALSPLEETYSRYNRRKLVVTAVILAMALVLAFVSLFLSQIMSTVTPDIVIEVLKAHLGGGSTDNRVAELVVWEYGVPRAVMGVTVGAGLAVAGAVMQSLLRNPLAEPYTTGVSSGASFGAALVFMLGFSIIPTSNYDLSVTTNAIILALVPTAAIVLISKMRKITPTTMILAGVAIMYVFRSMTSLMTLMSDSESIEQLYIWNVGTLGNASWDNIWIVLAVTAVCIALLQLMSRNIQLMSTGDKSASSMGVPVKLLRAIGLVIVAVMTAIIVGYTGTIGFMGLVAPHIARMLVGSNMKYLIPCSAAVGALVLVGCDCFANVLINVPVGVVTCIVGGPVFIVLLIKGAKRVWYRGGPTQASCADPAGSAFSDPSSREGGSLMGAYRPWHPREPPPEPHPSCCFVRGLAGPWMKVVNTSTHWIYHPRVVAHGKQTKVHRHRGGGHRGRRHSGGRGGQPPRQR